MSSVPTSYIIRYCHECVGYSCVINQWHLEYDCMQCGVFVPVFHTDVMQAPGSCRI